MTITSMTSWITWPLGILYAGLVVVFLSLLLRSWKR